VLAVATLVSWLLTEILGAYMLSSWIASGARGMSRLVMAGHAGLAFSGLICWIVFLVTAAGPLAWVATGLLAPAIGLGISTVTLWTPYPARRPPAERATGPASGTVLVSDEMLEQVLADDTLASKLVDDLLASMLTPPRPAVRRRWNYAPLIPAVHGLLAIATFSLAMLAAIAALS
jgi:hypothetical protein